MEMIEQELRRLRTRVDELKSRILPDLENRTQTLYALIMQLQKDSHEREKLESEYNILSKDLRLRSDEVINLNQQIDNIESQKSLRR